MPSHKNSKETSRPIVTALHATPGAESGETPKTTTIANTAGIPMNNAAVCWRLCQTITRYAMAPMATATMRVASAIRALVASPGSWRGGSGARAHATAKAGTQTSHAIKATGPKNQLGNTSAASVPPIARARIHSVPGASRNTLNPPNAITPKVSQRGDPGRPTSAAAISATTIDPLI